MLRSGNQHTRSSFFLVEIMLCILFFALSCSICIRIFVKAYVDREESRSLNRVQVLVTGSGEILSSWTGDVEEYAARMREAGFGSEKTCIAEPGATAERDSAVVAGSNPTATADDNSTAATGGVVRLYFDKEWMPCDPESCFWQMEIRLSCEMPRKTADIRFLNEKEDGSVFYEIQVSYPWWKETDFVFGIEGAETTKSSPRQ